MKIRTPSIPCALAVVFRQDAVILVRRANPPDVGLWGFPGGKIEAGETISEAAIRELYEETQVTASACGLFTVDDAFEKNLDGTLIRHFLLFAVLCRWIGGEPVAGDDALEARWFSYAELVASSIPKSADVVLVVTRARAVLQRGPSVVVQP